MTNDVPFGRKLRACRALLGWRQADLAAASGLGVNSIRRLEADACHPRRATLTVLALAMGIDARELIADAKLCTRRKERE